MSIQEIPIIMNGVTGRMGTNQHLARSITAIIKEGGVKISPELTLMPKPTLTGRSAEKLAPLAEKYGKEATGTPFPYSTDVAATIKEAPKNAIFFDASGTLQRAKFIEMAADAGLAIYCEKPTAVESKEAFRLADVVESKGLKNGVVQDKLFLPSFRKIRMLKELGFFGDILSVRGEFGYWVFTGLDYDQPTQRPSWNYRSEDGGGIIIDMFCHWQYLIEDLFGPIQSLVAHAKTDLPKRKNEDGSTYEATADDSAYAIFELENGIPCQFNSSWVVRPRRDDLLTVEIHGTKGSAVAGLRDVYTQSSANTPKPVWNPDIPQPINFYEGWEKVPDNLPYDNAFKIQWEMFLRHVALDEDWKHSLREGAKGVRIAELGMESWKERRWVDVS